MIRFPKTPMTPFQKKVSMTDIRVPQNGRTFYGDKILSFKDIFLPVVSSTTLKKDAGKTPLIPPPSIESIFRVTGCIFEEICRHNLAIYNEF